MFTNMSCILSSVVSVKWSHSVKIGSSLPHLLMEHNDSIVTLEVWLVSIVMKVCVQERITTERGFSQWFCQLMVN